MLSLKIDTNLCKNLDIKFMYLFGSQVKGTDVTSSDIDIAILFSNNFSGDELFRRVIVFTQEMKSRFNLEFDVVALNNATSLLKYEVISHGKVLYSLDEQERLDFEVDTVKEYIDNQHFQQIYTRALKERISQGVYKW